MWGALLVAFFIFGLAYIFVYTGMANSLAYGLSKIGLFFVVLAPILGWIGVALSGSNTSTNAMFGPVQAVTGKLLNLPALLLPTFNSVGAEVGKPIAPQTASVGVSTSKFVRSEGQVIRQQHGLDACGAGLSDPHRSAFLLRIPPLYVALVRMQLD